MYNGLYSHYPSFPYGRRQGYSVCSPYEIPEPVPLPDVGHYPSPYYHDYPYRRHVPYVDYPPYDYAPPPMPAPIIQTNVQNEISYYGDSPEVIYDDGYADPYRFSRPSFRVARAGPRTTIQTQHSPMVLSTVRHREAAERVLLPRPTILRHPSLPVYERPRPARLMPLYHSADPHYVVSHRRRPIARDLVPLTTVSHSYHRPHRRVIKVRSLSP